MAETVTIDRPSVARGLSRPRSRKPATVSASALALHLDCSRPNNGKLEAEGVIQRQGRGLPLDQSRVAYLRYLRRERRQSPRVEADADHVKVRTEMLQLRLMEKWRELVRRADVDALIDGSVGVTLTCPAFPHAARRVAILRPGAASSGRVRTIVAAPTHHRGEMNRMIVNEAGDDVGRANLDGVLIKGHQRIDVELKHRRKQFFSTGGALVRIHCITIDHVAHKITLAVDGFSREGSSQHTA